MLLPCRSCAQTLSLKGKAWLYELVLKASHNTPHLCSRAAAGITAQVHTLTSAERQSREPTPATSSLTCAEGQSRGAHVRHVITQVEGIRTTHCTSCPPQSGPCLLLLLLLHSSLEGREGVLG